MLEQSANGTRQPGLFVPAEPKTIEETGLDIGFLSDLILKVLYFQGYRKGSDIAEVIKLPFQGVIDAVITFLVRERMVEIKGGAGVGRASYDFAITDRGGVRAREVLGRNQYIGPAPVNLHCKAITRRFVGRPPSRSTSTRRPSAMRFRISSSAARSSTRSGPRSIPDGPSFCSVRPETARRPSRRASAGSSCTTTSAFPSPCLSRGRSSRSSTS